MLANLLFFGLCIPQTGASQERPAAAPEDVATIGAIIDASYDLISGSADEQRDWDRERSLFHPESRHMPAHGAESGGWVVDVMSVDGFIERAEPYFAANDFYEYETSRKIERFGNIATCLARTRGARDQTGTNRVFCTFWADFVTLSYKV